ncbi:MAG: response regulator transcription factor [Bacteroidia bacterium]|nr:response regulator transcription factor [Bacteroidia bacterium]
MESNRVILLADDHVIIRRGFKSLIENHCGPSQWVEADSVNDVLKVLEETKITHMVLDMQLLNSHILDVLQNLIPKYPQIPILIYSMSSEDIYAARLKKMGVKAFLSKQSDEAEVIHAMRSFFEGLSYFSQKVRNQFMDKSFKSTNPMMQLSERELAVLHYLLQGISVKEISTRLDVKATTTATYKARIFDKLNVSNLFELKELVEQLNDKSIA